MSLDPYGIHLGPLYFRYYGLILMAGAVAAAYFARLQLRKLGRDPEVVWDGLIWVLIFGILGARLYHVLTPSISAGATTWDYLRNPLDILFTWRGGLGMPGAIGGGALGLYLFARRRKLSFRLLLDVAAPGVALAQAIGRWGNFVNQELYGLPTDLPWGIFIRPENRLEEVRAFERFHPLFLYESLWNLANAGFLYWLWTRHRARLKSGDLFLIYLANYSVGRFLLEFLRIDIVMYFGINFNQWLMLAVAIACAVVLYLRHRPQAGGAPAGEPVKPKRRRR